MGRDLKASYEDLTEWVASSKGQCHSLIPLNRLVEAKSVTAKSFGGRNSHSL